MLSIKKKLSMNGRSKHVYQFRFHVDAINYCDKNYVERSEDVLGTQNICAYGKVRIKYNVYGAFVKPLSVT